MQDLGVVVLPIHGAEELSPADYKLVYSDTMTGEDGLPLLYILAPKDLVVAQPRGLLDHIDWCAERGDYEEAIAVAQEYVSTLPSGKMEALVDSYITALIGEGEVEEVCICV